MQIEQTGKVFAVLPEQRFNGKNGEVVKNAFVIEWQDNGYRQLLCLDVIGQEKWDKMKHNIVVGKDVQVRFSVSSREYQGRYFTGVNCFYCAAVGETQSATQTQTPQYGTTQRPADNEEEVPF